MKSIYIYRQFAGSIKKLIQKPDSNVFIDVISKISPIIRIFINNFDKWFLKSHEPTINAKYAPVIFSFSPDLPVRIFQTLAIKNFLSAFSEKSLHNFVNEAGICIAHTYLASMERHHKGRLFLNMNGDISEGIDKAWTRLSDLVHSRKIWNPTLSELVEWVNKFEKIHFELSESGNVFFTGPEEINTRITYEIILV